MDFLESLEQERIQQRQQVENGNENGSTVSSSTEGQNSCIGNSELSCGVSSGCDNLSKKRPPKEEGEKASKKRPMNLDQDNEIDNDVFTPSYYKKKKKMEKNDFIKSTRNRNEANLDFYEDEFAQFSDDHDDDGDSENPSQSSNQNQSNNIYSKLGLIQDDQEVTFLYMASLVRGVLKTNTVKFDRWLAQISTCKNFLNCMDRFIRNEAEQTLILKNGIVTLLYAFCPTKKGSIGSTFEKHFYETLYEKCPSKILHCIVPNQKTFDYYVKDHINTWFLI